MRKEIVCECMYNVLCSCSAFRLQPSILGNTILAQLLTCLGFDIACTWFFFSLSPEYTHLYRHIQCSIRYTYIIHVLCHTYIDDMCQCNTFRLHRHVCVLWPISSRAETAYKCGKIYHIYTLLCFTHIHMDTGEIWWITDH